MKETLRYLAGLAGPSGYGSNSTAEQVTEDFSCMVPPHLTAIITGATSGIGAETARVLAKKGVRIVIPARDLRRAAELKEEIQKESPQAEIVLLEVDLSSLTSVKRFCTEFLSLGLSLNILINNAGIFSQNLEFSEDKIEMTYATNYLGHFLLTEMLLEKMVETAAKTGIQGRIINVTSVIHSWVKRDSFCFNQMLNPKNYNGTRAYAQSKLANILHVKEMARQLQARNARVTINAVHPGIVKTGIIRAHKGFITDSIYFVASKFLKSSSQGASTTCYVALCPQLEGVTGLELALKHNSLSGNLSNSSFDGLTQLEVVELGENSFTGTLQPWFFLLPSLQQVDLANNSLTRVEVWKPAGGNSNLVAVDLGFNGINGYLPVNFASYPVLASLTLRYNRIRGKIPLEYSKNKFLRRLYLDGNFLIGKPPAEFFAGGTSVSGSLGYNCLQGCPASSQLCVPSQKPSAMCKHAYRHHGDEKPRS